MNSFPWAQILGFIKGQPLGTILDAGTGEVSLRALLAVDTSSITAVTACPKQLKRLRLTFSTPTRSPIRLIQGYWSSSDLLEGEVYDTILMHHLVGAMECFEPDFTPQIFRRMRTLAGGRVFVVGFEPLTARGSFLTDFVRRLFDFRARCQLLANQRPYREHSADWVVDRLQEADFCVVSRTVGPAVLDLPFLQRLSSVAAQLHSKMPNEVAEAMVLLGEDLKQEGLELLDINSGKIVYGEEYLITASRSD